MSVNRRGTVVGEGERASDRRFLNPYGLPVAEAISTRLSSIFARFVSHVIQKVPNFLRYGLFQPPGIKKPRRFCVLRTRTRSGNNLTRRVAAGKKTLATNKSICEITTYRLQWQSQLHRLKYKTARFTPAA